MARTFLYYAVIILYSFSTVAQVKQRASQRNTVTTITPVTTVTTISPVSHVITRMTLNKDSIPISRHSYYVIDQARFKKYMSANVNINKDSVLLEKAKPEDWTEFENQYAILLKLIKRKPNDLINNYVDTTVDFKSLKFLSPERFPNTAKICMKQLTVNLKLVTNILSRPIYSKQDVEELNLVMANIDKLSENYINTYGHLFAMFAPNVQFKVTDASGSVINNAKCYLLSKKTCRDIACRTCNPGGDACDIQTVASLTKIVNEKDIMFDCANPADLRVSYGHYHLFVVCQDKLCHYELRDFDENSLTASNLIKIVLR